MATVICLMHRKIPVCKLDKCILNKMKIYKKDNKCIVELDLLQDSYDACGSLIGKVPNLVGNIIERKNGLGEYTINKVIDLGYKGSQDLGMEIICLNSREELEETCKDLGLQINETPMCAYCDSPIWGAFYLGDKGNMCYDCHLKEEKLESEDKTLTKSIYKEVKNIDEYYEKINKDVI